MTAEEFGRVGNRLLDAWPKHMQDKAVAKTYGILAELPYEQVMAAIESYHREAREFAPSAGTIYQRANETRVNAPDWEWAYAQLRRLRAMIASPHFDMTDGRGRPSRNKERTEEIVAEWPPVLRNFVEDCGYGQLAENLTNEEHGEVRLRQKYGTYVNRAIQDVAMANIRVEGAEDLPRIQDARRNAPRHLGEVMGDTLKRLGPG